MPTCRTVRRDPELTAGTRVGVRLVSGWKKKRYDAKITKNLPSKLFNATARSVSGIRLHDFNCGLKAYKSTLAKDIEVYNDMHRYIPVLAKNAGYRKITEKVVQHQGHASTAPASSVPTAS